MMETFPAITLMLVYGVQAVLCVDGNWTLSNSISWMCMWGVAISMAVGIIIVWFLFPIKDNPTVKIPKTYTVVMGESVKLKWSVSAFPFIKSVSWEHVSPEGQTIQLDIDQQKYTRSKPKHLVINNTSKDDEGEYVCTVYDWYGRRRSATTWLMVEGGSHSYTGDPIRSHSVYVHQHVESTDHLSTESPSGNPQISTESPSSKCLPQVQSSASKQEHINISDSESDQQEETEDTTSPKIPQPEGDTDNCGYQKGDTILQFSTPGDNGPETEHMSGEAGGERRSTDLQEENTEITIMAANQSQEGAAEKIVPALSHGGTRETILVQRGEANVLGDRRSVTIKKTEIDEPTADDKIHTEIKKIHEAMVKRLANFFYPDARYWKEFVTVVGTYLDPKQLEGSLHDIVANLLMKNHIEYGQYRILYDAVHHIDVTVSPFIEKAEADIKTRRERSEDSSEEHINISVPESDQQEETEDTSSPKIPQPEGDTDNCGYQKGDITTGDNGPETEHLSGEAEGERRSTDLQEENTEITANQSQVWAAETMVPALPHGGARETTLVQGGEANVLGDSRSVTIKKTEIDDDKIHTEIKKIHAAMVNRLANYFYPDARVWKEFVTVVRSYLDPKQLEGSLHDIVANLLMKKHIEYGQYRKLYDAVHHIDVTASPIITEAESDIKTIREGGDIKDRQDAMSTDRDNLKDHVGAVGDNVNAVRDDACAVRDHVNAVKDYVGAVRSDVGDVKDNVGVVRDNISAVRDDVDPVRDDVGDVKDNIDAVRSDVGAEMENVGAVKDNVDAVKDDVIAVRNDVNAVRDGVGAVKDDVIAVKDDVIAVKDDVIAVRDNVNAVRDNVGAVKSDVGAVKDDVIAVRDDINAVRDDVGAVRDGVGAVGDDVGAVKDDVGVVRRGVDLVKDDVGAVSDKVDAVTGDVGAVKSDVGAVKDDVIAVRDNVNAVRDNVGAVKSDVGAVKDDVIAVRDDINAVRDDVGAVRDGVGAVGDDVGAVKDDVGVVRRGVDLVKDDVGAVSDKVDAVTGDVGAVKSDVGAVKDDVIAVRDDVNAVKDDVGAVRDDVGPVRDDVGAVRDDVNAMKSDLDAVRECVIALKAERDKVDAVRGYVGAVTDDVGAVRSDVGAVRDDVNAVKDDVGAVREGVIALKEQLNDLSSDDDARHPITGHSEAGDDTTGAQVIDAHSHQGIEDHSHQGIEDHSHQGIEDHSQCQEPDIQKTDYADIIHELSMKYCEPETAVIPVICCKDSTLKFIVYSDACNRETYQNYFGHDTIFKNPKVVSNEAIDVMVECQSKNCYLTAQQRNRLQRFIQQNAEKLFSAHSNLNIISMSAIKSKGGEMIKDRPSIVLYCTSKGYIPVGEKEFPKTVSMANQMVDIDVREGHFQFGYLPQASNFRHDKLKMGCEFSVENGSFTGTIGPFVDFQGELAFLTCAHTIFGIDANGYDKQNVPCFVEQPGSQPTVSNVTHQSANRCGQVRRAVFSPQSNNASVDAAVVVITDQGRIPSRGEFAIAKDWQYKLAGFDHIPSFQSGRIHDDPATIDNDVRIVKFGAETHVTRGAIHCYGTFVRPLSTELGLQGNPQQITMKDQLEILCIQAPTAFFQSGDSGSAVFYVDKSSGSQELVCIGMAIGCTTYGTGVVTPIAYILNALSLTPGTLKSFP